MLKILEEMKEDDDGKDIKTKVWIYKINVGCVLFIDDVTFLLFLVIEYATTSSLSALMVLNLHTILPKMLQPWQ